MEREEIVLFLPLFSVKGWKRGKWVAQVAVEDLGYHLACVMNSAWKALVYLCVMSF